MTPSDLAAIALASLVGSLHCALMCGPFLPLMQRSQSRAATRVSLTAYHLGRGIAYLSLGAMAGALGAGLQASALGLGMQRALAIGMALGLVFAAYRIVKPQPSLVKLKRRATPRPIAALQTWVMELREGAHPGLFALALGTASALLPCGWLWSYLWLAATRSTLQSGVLTMAAFWLGTLPALTLVGWALPRLTQNMKRHAPKVGAMSLLLLAAWTLVERWPQATGPAHCAGTPTVQAR